MARARSGGRCRDQCAPRSRSVEGDHAAPGHSAALSRTGDAAARACGHPERRAGSARRLYAGAGAAAHRGGRSRARGRRDGSFRRTGRATLGARRPGDRAAVGRRTAPRSWRRSTTSPSRTSAARRTRRASATRNRPPISLSESDRLARGRARALHNGPGGRYDREQEARSRARL